MSSHVREAAIVRQQAHADATTTVDIDALRARISLGPSIRPRPFLRWAGAKRRLLSSLVDVLPTRFGAYHEPFLGGGSLYFLLRPRRAFLGDSCKELTDTYIAVRDEAEAVIESLRPLDPEREVFYHVRSNRSSDPLARAAEFIYLNKTCWNGLYRVNLRGEFNVPYGGPHDVTVYDDTNLRDCGSLLSTARIRSGDFEDVIASASAGDLVFFDPPYVTRHNNNGFIDYNDKLFSWADQIRLASVARKLCQEGVHVVVTNAYHQDLIDLYDGFRVKPVERASTLAGKSSKRGRVMEALIWSTSMELTAG